MKIDMLCPLVKGGVQPPLFLAPAAGSTPLSMFKLARSLEPQRTIYALEYPGMQDGQSEYESVEELALAYAGEIRRIQKSGPYLLGGHCFGGIIAHAIGTIMEAAGEKVAALVLLETIAPLDDSVRADLEATEEQVRLSPTLGAAKHALHAIFEQSRRQLERLPPEISEPLIQLSWKQTLAGSIYRAKPIDAEIILVRTQKHPREIFLAWKQLGLQGLTEHTIPGDALSMLSPPLVDIVAAQLSGLNTALEQ